MFLSVIPHDWQREFNAWIVNETGWLKQGEHSGGGGPSGQLFVEVGDLVALLQAKARRYLAEHPAA